MFTTLMPLTNINECYPPSVCASVRVHQLVCERARLISNHQHSSKMPNFVPLSGRLYT